MNTTRIYEPINQKKFIRFSKSNFHFNKKYKGGFYPLKNLNQFIFITKKDFFKPIKNKILNRKANFIYEIEQEKYFICLINYETQDQYLSLKRLFLNQNYVNRSDNTRQETFKSLLKYEK